jgi:hypothetical protein
MIDLYPKQISKGRVINNNKSLLKFETQSEIYEIFFGSYIVQVLMYVNIVSYGMTWLICLRLFISSQREEESVVAKTHLISANFSKLTFKTEIKSS